MFDKRHTAHRPRIIITLLAGLFGTLLLSQGGYIHLKALLAQHLLEQSWQSVQAGQGNSPPWPWADTSPVARLRVPHLAIEQIILAGDSPRNLAFGPGHNLATAAPGKPGHSLISAHRDTHFAFLSKIKPGDTFIIETPEGQQQRYQVFWQQVTSKHQVILPGDDRHAYIHLVTCYPFDAIDPSTDQRYIVSARRLTESPEKPTETTLSVPHRWF